MKSVLCLRAKHHEWRYLRAKHHEWRCCVMWVSVFLLRSKIAEHSWWVEKWLAMWVITLSKMIAGSKNRQSELSKRNLHISRTSFVWANDKIIRLTNGSMICLSEVITSLTNHFSSWIFVTLSLILRVQHYNKSSFLKFCS